MSIEQGKLSINSENIFPIIKKWLYSDHDIFYRELISNACDAVTKLKKLDVMGEVSLPDDNAFRIDVIVSPEKKTITIIDNGIGMTADEVKEYINQIAFSGAEAFLSKYKDKTNEEQIIGHFGLGFYSAFMVSDLVEINTLSWMDGAKAVAWKSDGGTDYEMSDSDKTTRGTEIILHLNEESYEFANEYRAKEVLKKYCSFMPVEIYFTNVDAKPEDNVEDDFDEELDDFAEDELNEEGSEDIIDAEVTEDGSVVETEDDSEDKKDKKEAKAEKKEPKKPQPINEIKPLWTIHPNDCTEEQYKNFYRDVFHDYKEPLFWIHLNMDYPFNLKGILYFPKINTEYDTLEGTIKLYNNQVFIADNIKEVIPEFLMLLKGVIDCPDLPLNVSRSSLQNDGFVKKISDYITKKVADKLSGMCKTEKESYEKYWDDISPFIKFGCLKDEKFKDKMKDFIIYKNLEGKYITVLEYQESNKEKAKSNIYYVTDEKQQSQYINMFKEEGIDAVILTHNIDQPFITQLEQGDDTLHFVRIDADITDTFKEEVAEDDKDHKEITDTLTELFKKVLGKEKLEVKVEKLKNDSVSSMITLSEESRRMQDMMKMYTMPGMDNSMFGANETLVLNANNSLVKYIFSHKDSDQVGIICEQLYDLALLSHKPLDAQGMTKFIARSNEIMMLLAK